MGKKKDSAGEDGGDAVCTDDISISRVDRQVRTERYKGKEILKTLNWLSTTVQPCWIWKGSSY